MNEKPIGKESVIFRVRAIGEEQHDENDEAQSRKLSGKDRLSVGKRANEVGPLKTFQEKVEDSKEDMLKAGNFTGCESIDVLKQAAADYRKHFRVDEDIFRECRIRQEIIEETDITSEEIKGYVQVMAEKPFHPHLTTEAQTLRFISYCEKKCLLTCTSRCKQIDSKELAASKEILLYAAVFKDGNDPTNAIPLGHALLADHTTTSISYFFGTPRQHIVTLRKEVIRPSFLSPIFLRQYLILFYSFSHEDMHGHLKCCWNVILRKYDAKEIHSGSFLRICCSHAMNVFARSLSAAKVPKDIRKKVLHIFALSINCGELEMSFKFLKRVLHMFGNPQATDAKEILQKFLEAPYDNETTLDKIGSCEIEIDERSVDPLDEVDENMHNSKAIIHQLPFNIEAIRRFSQLSELLDSEKKYENVTNTLFSRWIVYVFYKWFSYLPLWTSVLTDFKARYSNDRAPIDIRAYEQGRLANAQVESHFGILKESILERRTNLRPAEAIVSLYRCIQAQLKADKFGVSQ